MLRLERIEELESVSRLREAWIELWESSPGATPFQHPTWTLAAWKHFGGRKKLSIWAIYDGPDLVGLYPLCISSFPWRALRPIGVGPSDYLGPLLRPGYEQVAAREIESSLNAGNGFDLIDLHQVRETHPLAETTSDRWREQARCFVLDLPNSWEEYRKTLSKSLRYECDRMKKAPYSEGNARFSVAQNPDEAEQALGIFLNLHEKRWRRRGLPGAFAIKRTRAFQSEFVRAAVADELLRLTVLWNESEPVGAIYALKGPDTYFFYQSGFDPSAKALSPGTVLVAKTIRMAIEEGATRFDFLRGDEAYKARWKPQQSYRNLRLTLARSPMGGQVGQWVNRTGALVEAKVRARLEGRGLIG